METYLADKVRSGEIKAISCEYTLCDGHVFRVVDYSPIGNDDEFYERNGYSSPLRRGTCLINGNRWLFGLPKFGYDFIPGPVYYITEKHNGECGHIQMYNAAHIAIGSKNVHIVLGMGNVGAYERDLAMYEGLGEKRLEYAVRIARLLWETGLVQNATLLSHLLQTQHTLVVEALFNNHIVYYDKRSFFAIAMTDAKGDIVDPPVFQGICEKYSIPFTPITATYSIEEYEKEIEYYVMDGRETEGAVVYVGKGCFKIKHPYYVAKRAARELIKRRASVAQWEERMKRLHVAVPQPFLAELFRFYMWLRMEHPRYRASTVQNNFAKWFKEFEEGKDKWPAYDPDEVFNTLEKNATSVVIAFVGMPGCGKSTLSRILGDYLRDTGATVCRVNQDELGRNKRTYLQKLEELRRGKDKAAEYILVDKSNHKASIREDVSIRFANVHWVVIGGEPNRDKEICIERIKARGPAHPSLVYSYKAYEVLEYFAQEFEPQPMSDVACHLDISHGVGDWMCKVLAHIGISIDTDILDKVLERAAKAYVPRILYWKVDLPNGNHITLAYRPSKEQNAKLMPFFGKEIDIRQEYILETDRIKVATIEKNEFMERYCANEHPHITLWTAHGVRPFEANDVFKDKGAKRLDIVAQYKGIITFEIA